MNISRRDPWNDVVTLREAMDSLLRESFVRPPEGSTFSGVLNTPMDVRETDDQFVIHATLPGIKPEDVDLQIRGDTVQISGETRQEIKEEDHGQMLMRERRYGRFHRTLTLPAMVNAEACEAEFENGVLTVRLAKAEEARARSIPVRAAGRGQAIEAQTGQQSSENVQTEKQGR